MQTSLAVLILFLVIIGCAFIAVPVYMHATRRRVAQAFFDPPPTILRTNIDAIVISERTTSATMLSTAADTLASPQPPGQQELTNVKIIDRGPVCPLPKLDRLSVSPLPRIHIDVGECEVIGGAGMTPTFTPVGGESKWLNQDHISLMSHHSLTPLTPKSIDQLQRFMTFISPFKLQQPDNRASIIKIPDVQQPSKQTSMEITGIQQPATQIVMDTVDTESDRILPDVPDFKAEEKKFPNINSRSASRRSRFRGVYVVNVSDGEEEGARRAVPDLRVVFGSGSTRIDYR